MHGYIVGREFASRGRPAARPLTTRASGVLQWDHLDTGNADRRTIRIALSPAGETRYGQLNETLDAHAQRVLARIPLAEQEQVAHVLALLYQSLQAEAEAIACTPSHGEELR
jgi:hypothetical protein